MSKQKILILSLIAFAMTGCQSIKTPSLNTKSVAPVESLIPDAQETKSRIDFKELKKQQNKPVVALVLGSGGARGYAHIGVIEVLEQYGIKPDLIVGTSAGSLVGSIYASGKSGTELREIALNLKPNDVRDVKIDKKGFFEGKKVEEFINQQVADTQLQSLKTPMYVIATELKEGKRVIFNYGNTGQAVRASVAIPSMFIPTKIGDDEYVDGGLVSPVPVEVAKELGADIVIAVNILAQPIYTETSNVWGLFNQNINIMQKYLAQEELKYADIVIQPDLREKAHIFDVDGREMTMQAGVDAANAELPKILKVLDQHKYPYKKLSNEITVKK